MRTRVGWVLAVAAGLGLSVMADRARGDCCEHQGICYQGVEVPYCTQYGDPAVPGGACDCGTSLFCFGNCVGPSTATPTETLTPSPTSTPTETPTPSPTATPTIPLALGDACSGPSQCASQFCVGGVCCNGVCALSHQTCTAPGHVGMCQTLSAEVPAASSRGVVVLGVVLAALALARLSRGQWKA
jgi:hypothetical protein